MQLLGYASSDQYGYCIPKVDALNSTALQDQLASTMNSAAVSEAYASLQASAAVMLGGAVFAVIVAAAYT